jgi:uncharacterized membrane protein
MIHGTEYWRKQRKGLDWAQVIIAAAAVGMLGLFFACLYITIAFIHVLMHGG